MALCHKVLAKVLAAVIIRAISFADRNCGSQYSDIKLFLDIMEALVFGQTVISIF